MISPLKTAFTLRTHLSFSVRMNHTLVLGFGNFFNLRSSSVIPRNSKVGALISVRPRAMGSQELSANLNNSISINTEPDKAVVNGDTAKSRIAEYGSVSNNLDNFERMTVQDLREKLRSMGFPAKGSKRDLVCALKTSFMKEVNDEDSQEVVEDEVSTKMNQFHGKTKSKRKANSSLCEDHTEALSMDDEASVDKKIKRRAKQVPTDINVISETSVSKQANRRVKQMQVESASIRVESVTCKNKKEPVMKTNEVTGKKYTSLKKDISSQVNPEDVEASERMDVSEHQIEPWTVLAHKKPQKSWIPYNPRNMRPPPLAGDTRSVKLMSWNVNGLRALMKLESFSALELAQREDFDVLCLQETKLQEKDVEAIKQALLEGYENSFWTCSVSKLGYSGTGIVSRIPPLSVRYGLGISDHDSEGRLVTAEFDSFYLINGYVPNSGDGLRRLSYRITEWDPSLSSYMKELEKSKPVILTGDLNCAHEEIDIYNPAGNKRSAGFTIEERKSFETNFLDKGFVDTFRKQHPEVVGYTYWGYRHGGRKTNKGWRLDYFLVSQSIADNVHDSFILPDVTGSDHCPIGLVLKI